DIPGPGATDQRQRCQAAKENRGGGFSHRRVSSPLRCFAFSNFSPFLRFFFFPWGGGLWHFLGPFTPPKTRPPGLNPRPREGNVGDGLVMVQEAALAHHQKMPETADMVVEGAQLAEHVVRRAGKNEAGIDRVGDGHRAGIEIAAVARLNPPGTEPGTACLDGLRTLRRRRVARRVPELWRDDARSAAVAQDLVGAAPATFPGIADPHHRPIS